MDQDCLEPGSKCAQVPPYVTEPKAVRVCVIKKNGKARTGVESFCLHRAITSETTFWRNSAIHENVRCQMKFRETTDFSPLMRHFWGWYASAAPFSDTERADYFKNVCAVWSFLLVFVSVRGIISKFSWYFKISPRWLWTKLGKFTSANAHASC